MPESEFFKREILNMNKIWTRSTKRVPVISTPVSSTHKSVFNTNMSFWNKCVISTEMLHFNTKITQNAQNPPKKKSCKCWTDVWNWCIFVVILRAEKEMPLCGTDVLNWGMCVDLSDNLKKLNFVEKYKNWF